MLALDDSKGDIFEQQTSTHGKSTNAKGSQLMKKMSGRIQQSLSGDDSKAEARARKFEKMAEKANNKMMHSNKNSKSRNSVFLKMMQKNHVFDSVMGSEIIGGNSQ